MQKPYRITIFPGDGIGPEVTNAAIAVLEATGLPFNWEFQELAATEDGLLPQAAVDSFKCTKLALKGPTATPSGEGHRSLNVQLREMFDLYANVRPVRTIRGKETRFSDLQIDLVIFRENTEDLYVGEEYYQSDGSTVAFARFSPKGCERIARYAFEYAKKHGRKRVTIVHKANICKETHGLFLRTAHAVARNYPAIACDDFIADNCLLQLVTRPERFDCLLLPNMLGDLVSDLAAGLVGGLGFAAGFNVGDEYAMAEAVHGTAPDIAGKNLANPTSLILSAALLLDHLGEEKAAKKIRHAVEAVIERGNEVTADVRPGNSVSTRQYAAAVVREIHRH